MHRWTCECLPGPQPEESVAHVHLSDRGYAAMAEHIDLALLTRD
jgi:hypothetical protein